MAEGPWPGAVEEEPEAEADAEPRADRSVEELTEQLMAVFDGHGRMVPPTAQAMSSAEWRTLGYRARAKLSRFHLAKLDPRLLPRAVFVWTSRRSQHSRHFHH